MKGFSNKHSLKLNKALPAQAMHSFFVVTCIRANSVSILGSVFFIFPQRGGLFMAKTLSLLACSCCITAALYGQDQSIAPLDSHEVYIDIGDNNTFNVFVTVPQMTESHAIDTNNENGDFVLTRRPGRKQLILAGLAQACSNLGQIVGATNMPEKQQGYLNLLSTVLQVSAELDSPHTTPQPVQQPVPAQTQPQAQTAPQAPAPTRNIQVEDENEAIAQLLLNLTEKLAPAHAAGTKKALMPLVEQIMKLSSGQDKLMWLKKLLGDKQLLSQFLQELFSLFYSVLCSYIPALATPKQPDTQSLQENVQNLRTEPMTDPQP